MQVEKEEIITAVKGLTRRANIKQEHLEIIDRALQYNNYNQEEWEEILNRNNIDLALNNKIYTMEMVRLLTLRAIILPDTIIEYFTWLSEGKKSDNNFLNYSLNFQQQIYKILSDSNIQISFISLKSLLVTKTNLNFESLLTKKINVSYKNAENYDQFIEYLLSFITDYQNIWKQDFNIEIENIEGSNQYYQEGEEFYKNGKYREAIIKFNKAIGLNPNFSRAYNWRGRAYQELKNKQKAIADYNKAIEIDPNYAHAYNCRGYYYESLNQYNKAIDDYNKAIYISPNYITAHNNRANCKYKLKIYRSSINDTNKVIGLKSNNKYAYFLRGKSYQKIGEYNQAISDYNKAIEIDPEYNDAYNYLFYTIFSIWVKKNFWHLFNLFVGLLNILFGFLAPSPLIFIIGLIVTFFFFFDFINFF